MEIGDKLLRKKLQKELFWWTLFSMINKSKADLSLLNSNSLDAGEIKSNKSFLVKKQDAAQADSFAQWRQGVNHQSSESGLKKLLRAVFS